MRRIITLLLLWLTLISMDYHSPVREPFADYQPQVAQPYYAPQATDWDNLPYDDATWGWYYKLMWYLSHPEGGIPPWEKPAVPIGDGVLVLVICSGIYITHKTKHRYEHNS